VVTKAARKATEIALSKRPDELTPKERKAFAAYRAVMGEENVFSYGDTLSVCDLWVKMRSMSPQARQGRGIPAALTTSAQRISVWNLSHDR
jgi:hypothetical protein